MNTRIPFKSSSIAVFVSMMILSGGVVGETSKDGGAVTTGTTTPTTDTGTTTTTTTTDTGKDGGTPTTDTGTTTTTTTTTTTPTTDTGTTTTTTTTDTGTTTTTTTTDTGKDGGTPITACTTGEVINNVCIPTGGLKKLESPLAIRSDGNGNNIAPATTSTFFGGISVDGGTPSKENLDVKVNQTISVDGLIVPQHQGVADIIAVGLYVPTAQLTGRATAQEYCDPELGDFYVNTASVDFTDNYCNWIVDRDGELKSTNGCNLPDNRRAALSSNVMNFWNAWGGHLNTLQPMYSNVSLDSNGVSKLLYKDTVNYTGQVCLYFGYRLTDRTLVFNGEPIIFRVSQ